MIKSISALAGMKSATGGQQLQLQDMRNRGLWQIDCWANSEAKVRDLLAQHTGMAVSDQAGSAVTDTNKRLMWAGPARYWFVSERGCDAMPQLAGQLSADDGHILDIGHSRCVIRLQGPAAQTVLQSGIAVDLDSEKFAAGHVIFSALSHHTPVTLHRLDEERFELYVYRSYAVHTMQWLLTAGKPYAVSLLAAD